MVDFTALRLTMLILFLIKYILYKPSTTCTYLAFFIYHLSGCKIIIGFYSKYVLMARCSGIFYIVNRDPILLSSQHVVLYM